jgi:hypothetical protein
MLADCNTGPKINVNIQGESLDLMNKYWVSYKGDNQAFWNHEYNKHGYCVTQRYNLGSETPYFELTLMMFHRHGLSTLMADAVGDIREEQEMVFSFDKLKKTLQRARPNLTFQLMCRFKKGKMYLQEVLIFFDIDFNAYEPKYKTNCVMDKDIYVRFEKE